MQTLRRILLVILGVALLTAGAIIGVENDTPLDFQLFGLNLGQLPAGLWILMAFTLGALLALFVTQLSITALRRRVRALNKQLVLAQQQSNLPH